VIPLKPVGVGPSPPRAVSRSVRKIALLGSHSASLRSCPWDDPSWELWGHAAARAWYARNLDRYFDLHRKECREREYRKHTKYPDWLAGNTVPIYMWEHYKEIPASIKYPKDRILLEYGGVRRYFKNHLAWMIALAFSEGVTHLALFGINYGHHTEYEIQRGSAEYWLGRAEERGVHLILPDECTLLQEPKGLYGYESHDDKGRLLDHWKPKVKDVITPLVPGKPADLVEPPEHVREQIEEETRVFPRPDWAFKRTDGEEVKA
jgi:hypothetical protein